MLLKICEITKKKRKKELTLEFEFYMDLNIYIFLNCSIYTLKTQDLSFDNENLESARNTNPNPY